MVGHLGESGNPDSRPKRDVHYAFLSRSLRKLAAMLGFPIKSGHRAPSVWVYHVISYVKRST